jgi:FtsH-binding integral membrane protein
MMVRTAVSAGRRQDRGTLMSVDTTARRDLSTSRFPRLVAILVGAILVGSGLWAMVAPATFFEAVATFEPYNRHFIQDLGAFQIGLGAVLWLALVPRADALAIALVGVGIGSAAHTISHAVGHDLGGNPVVDIPTWVILTVVLLVAGGLRWRASR